MPLNPLAKRLLAACLIACAGLACSGEQVRLNEISAYPTLVADASLRRTDWRHAAFSDAAWPRSPLPAGMDTASHYTLAVNLRDQMYMKVTSLYLRSVISVPQELAQSAAAVTLMVDYDDAFVLYINGVAAAHANVAFSGEPLPHTAVSLATHRASNDNGDGVDHTETFDLGPASGLFRAGANCLAVHLVNQHKISTDAYLQLSLRIGDTVITDPAASWAYFVGTGEPSPRTQQAGIEADWIELHNYGDTTVNLGDWSLTDNAGAPRKWVFPEVVLPAGGHLLVFASDVDQRDPDAPLQAPFKLSSGGEYLALINPAGAVVSQFAPAFPAQESGTSYGWDAASQSYRVFTALTPGTPNASTSYAGVTADTKFSVNRGFYDAPFSLEITTATSGATIRYTLDGSAPTATNGIHYTGPIAVGTTTVVRAYAFKEGFLPTNVDTHSYIFINDVINQGNAPAGYPATWKNLNNKADLPADYGMDPEVTNDRLYRDQMRAALLALPTISLVTDKAHFFDRTTGIYMNPTQTGMEWERPVSVELLYPDGREGFQIDAGIRMQGGHVRDPERNPKHSFRLAFRDDYGDGDLKFPLFPEADATTTFDTLILRGGGNQSWVHHNNFRGDNRARAQYVRDPFAKDLQGLMGSPHLHNLNAFLYINGLFWGLYNPTERASNQFGAAYLGGDEDDFDAVNSGELIDGNLTAWNQLLALVRQDTRLDPVYDQIAARLDLEAFTDYMLLNHWGGNEDWDHHNWYALGNRNGGKFYFFAWDSEFFFETAAADTTLKNTPDCPGGIFHSLVRNPHYRALVAGRLRKHLFGAGALTTSKALEVWNERSRQIELAVIAESARWGDYRRDVHRTAPPYELYTRDNQWLKERTRLLTSVIPVRTTTTLAQYKRLGLVPSNEPDPGGVGWIDDAAMGWIWSPTGLAAAGSWVYWLSLSRFSYIAWDYPSGKWIWVPWSHAPEHKGG